jgi:hypothetical protein
MGAYQNPEQVKDYTMDIAKAWANATNTVVEGITKIGDQQTNFYEAKIKEYNQNKVDVKKEQQSLYDNIDKMAVGFGGANFRTTFDPLVKKYADISLRIKNNTSEDESKDMQALSRIESMINLTKTGIEKQMSYKKDFLKAYETGTNPGGFDAVQAIDDKGNNILNHMNSIFGNIPGEKKIEIVYDDEGLPKDVEFITTGTLGGKDWQGKVSATGLNKSNDFGIDLIPIIPDANKILGEQLSVTNLVQKINVTNPSDGTTAPKIIGPADSFYDFKMQPTGKSTGGVVSEESVGELSKTRYIDALKTDKVFISAIDGLIANPQKAAALMNSTGYRAPGETAEYKASQFIKPTPELQALFTQKTAEYYYSNQPKNRIQTNNVGEAIINSRAKTQRELFEDQIDIELKRKPFDKKGKSVINTKNSTITVIKDESQPKGYKFTVVSNK